MSIGTPKYPADHKAAMGVPQGGSCCANCEYLKDAEKRICGNQYFVQWNGSNKIPAPIDQFCSDWYEPADKKSLGARLIG